jgi:deoxyribose-phosphate aldolase
MIIDIASYLDLANHDANTTVNDIEHICKKVLTYGFHSAFANPQYVALMKKLIGTKAHIGTVISFPLGQETLRTKITSLEEVIQLAADQLDIVLNIGAIKEHRWKKVFEEMKTLVDIAHNKNPEAVVQFIPETGYLTPDEIQKTAELMVKAGAPFFKTCSGYGPRGATLQDIKLIRQAVGNNIRIKAAGGIHTYQKAIKFILAGADRIGTSRAVDIVTKRQKKKPSRGE